MNYGIIGHILSKLIFMEGLFLLVPAGVAFLYGETRIAMIYLGVAACCFLIGILGRMKKPKSTAFYAREGFVIASAGWIILGMIGALPFVISGEIPNYIDAIFETVSGFTTTGSSVLVDVEALSRGNMFWRCFTHWMGGMGILVLMMAVMPLSGSYNLFLMKAESPGPDVDKIMPRIMSSAAMLYKIYSVITCTQIIALLIAGLDLYEASTLTFSTVGTGGFALLSDSIASYNLAVQIIITIFMLICSVNFNVYFFLAVRRFKDVLHFEEMWVFLGIVFVTATCITINIHSQFQNVFKAFHTALFQVASVISTTGFATVDFNLWPQFSKALLVMVMVIGACAGSTGGGLKVSRLVILVKSAKKSVALIAHPRSVRKIHLNGKVLSDRMVHSVMRFLVIYCVVMFLSFILVSLDNFDAETSITAVLTTLNNVGPGLGIVGPNGNFSSFSYLSKIVMIFDMLAGRLEFYPLLILFTPSTWKRF